MIILFIIFILEENIIEAFRKKEREYADKPLLGFRFPAQEDLSIASKLDGGTTPQPNNNNDISDMNIIGGKINLPEEEGGTIFDLLANNPMLGVRGTSSQTSNAIDTRRRQDKLKEHLINATKMPSFDTFHKDTNESNVIEFSKDESEKLRSSSDPERRPKSTTNNGIEPASVAASVQAALSALQAGQLSLNQVRQDRAISTEFQDMITLKTYIIAQLFIFYCLT